MIKQFNATTQTFEIVDEQKERNSLITKAALWIIREPKATVSQAKKMYGLSVAETEKLELRIKSIKATTSRMASEFFGS